MAPAADCERNVAMSLPEPRRDFGHSRRWRLRHRTCFTARKPGTYCPRRQGRAMADFLAVERLSKQFSAHGHAACKDISFAVGRREFVALIGPSGCGKSTLLHMGGGVSAPTAGRTRLRGEPMHGPRAGSTCC